MAEPIRPPDGDPCLLAAPVDRMGIGPRVVELTRTPPGLRFPARGSRGGSHRGLSPPPSFGPSLLGRRPRAEQVGRRVDLEPGTQDLLRLRPEMDPPVLVVM